MKNAFFLALFCLISLGSIGFLPVHSEDLEVSIPCDSVEVLEASSDQGSVGPNVMSSDMNLCDYLQLIDR